MYEKGRRMPLAGYPKSKRIGGSYGDEREQRIKERE